jgi:ABC-type multidrug transport system ATPase subunit
MELIARRLSKVYGAKQALSGVHLTARPGVLALLGPNGSGKTTLLRLLATVARPDAGEIAFGGRVYSSDIRAVRRRLGYLPQDLELPGHLTVRQFLHYMAGLKGIAPEPAAADLLDALDLAGLAGRKLGDLSGGQLRRAALAQALLGDPLLLILDEPTAGLDPEERDRVLRLISRPVSGRVVILSSHVPGEVEAAARQVVVLNGGQVAFAGSVPEMLRAAQGRVHEVTVPAGDVGPMLDRFQVSRVTARGGAAVLRLVGDLPQAMAGTAVDGSLEDAYLLMLSSAAR